MRLRRFLGVIGIAVGIVVLFLAGRSRRPQPLLPRPPHAPEATAPSPSSTAPPIASVEVPAERHTTVVVPWEAEPTPSPTPPPFEEEPTTRPGPSPTPDVSECVTTEFSASMLAGAPGQVMVDITATNGCGRDLAPLEVWFWVAGYRQGEIVQAVRGHPFDPIPRDGDADIHIALPGSIDWYDRIEVRAFGPDSP